MKKASRTILRAKYIGALIKIRRKNDEVLCRIVSDIEPIRGHGRFVCVAEDGRGFTVSDNYVMSQAYGAKR